MKDENNWKHIWRFRGSDSVPYTIAVTELDRRNYLVRKSPSGSPEVAAQFLITAIYRQKSPAVELKPPAAGMSILSWLARGDSLEALLGDLEEGYKKRAMEQGVSAARRWFYWQVAGSVLVFLARALELLARIHEALKKLGL